MRYDRDIWPVVRTHTWKWQTGRVDIVGVIVHSTRSGIAGRTPAMEYQSAVNWMLSPNNFVDTSGVPASQGGDPSRKWYGGMSHLIIGGGQICHVVPDELVPRFSAGIHDFRALSIEMGQARLGDPFDPADIALLRQVLEEKSQQYGFPLQRVAWVDGNNRGWPGIVGHEDTAQGRGQGKSDPGALLWQQLDLEDAMTPEERKRLERLERLLAGHGEITVTVTAENGDVVALLTGQATPGTTVTFRGADALAYLDFMGNNFWLGLANVQQRVSALERTISTSRNAAAENITISFGNTTYRVPAEKEGP